MGEDKIHFGWLPHAAHFVIPFWISPVVADLLADDRKSGGVVF